MRSSLNSSFSDFERKGRSAAFFFTMSCWITISHWRQILEPRLMTDWRSRGTPSLPMSRLTLNRAFLDALSSCIHCLGGSISRIFANPFNALKTDLLVPPTLLVKFMVISLVLFCFSLRGVGTIPRVPAKCIKPFFAFVWAPSSNFFSFSLSRSSMSEIVIDCFGLGLMAMGRKRSILGLGGRDIMFAGPERFSSSSSVSSGSRSNQVSISSCFSALAGSTPGSFLMSREESFFGSVLSSTSFLMPFDFLDDSSSSLPIAISLKSLLLLVLISGSGLDE